MGAASREKAGDVAEQPKPVLPSLKSKDAPENRVLVVEDDPVNQKVIMMTLHNLGYNTKAVMNGQEAIESLKTEPFGVVLMDIQMPIMDGFEATKLIRDPKTGVLNPAVPIIAFTAHALKGYREQCLEFGMNDHLSKPFRMEILDAILKKWLSITIPGQSDGAGTPTSLDQNILTVLKRDAGEGFGQLLTMFINELPEKIELIASATAAKNLKEVKNIVHKLKSNCGTFGAFSMLEICKKIEDSIETGLSENTPFLIKELKAESNEVLTTLRQQLNK
jgi:CheY-like chemotaxis protein